MNLSELRSIILIFTVIVNSLLAFVVYKNNPKSATNKIFAGLSIVTTLWLIDVFLSVEPTYINYSLLWIRLSVFFAAPQILLFFLFAHTLPDEKVKLNKLWRYALPLATLLVMVDALSHLAFTSVNIVNQRVQANPGPGIGLFSLFAISLSLGSVYILIKKWRRATGYLKEQYRYILLGLVAMLGLLSGTVLVPVALFKNSDFVPLAPLYTVAFLGCATYAIVRKRLFDIRLAVARAVAYLLVLGSLAVIYGVIVFSISVIVFNEPLRQNLIHRFLNIALALILVFTFQPIKRFFDRFTNKIFYREGYDPQNVLNKINKILTKEISLKAITNSALRIICEDLKIMSGNFIVVDKGNIYRVASYGQTKADAVNSSELKELRHSVMVADEFESGISKQILEKYNISLSLRLETKDDIVGYILLTAKQNSNPYSIQDVRLLSLIASELSIAVQNARSFEEISQFNITLQQKVEAATHELRNANERLKELDKTKDEFISMASHQLRTPLTAVKGYVSMLMEGDAGKLTKSEKDMLARAFEGANRMAYLITDMLNVSRMETGKFIIENKPTDLVKLVAAEINQLKKTAEDHQVTVNFHKPDNLPSLMIDDNKIKQVVMNFIDNAIFYTPSGGVIDVSLTHDESKVEFRVKDNGIGVPKSEQANLFTKFYRADNARQKRPDGTGLGLFMAKKVIDAQEGTIIFESAEGKGSTFGFSLPKKLMTKS